MRNHHLCCNCHPTPSPTNLRQQFQLFCLSPLVCVLIFLNRILIIIFLFIGFRYYFLILHREDIALLHHFLWLTSLLTPTSLASILPIWWHSIIIHYSHPQYQSFSLSRISWFCLPIYKVSLFLKVNCLNFVCLGFFIYFYSVSIIFQCQLHVSYMSGNWYTGTKVPVLEEFIGGETQSAISTRYF